VFERFSPSARAAVVRACDIAATDGAATVEAEHLLLALTERMDEPTSRVLDTLGITEATVRAALDTEFVDALQTVGIAAARPPSRRSRSKPTWGQSAKLVLVRNLQVAVERGDKRMDTRHLLLAISHAEAGVIPRVLRTLEVSASDIAAALR